MRNKHKNPYSKLSRKELQNLCKKYGLPAIGPSPHLAASLFALFKESNLDPLGEGWDVNPAPKQSNMQSDVGKGWDANPAPKQSNIQSDVGEGWDVNPAPKQSNIQSDVGEGWDINSASKQSNIHSDGQINCVEAIYEGSNTCFQLLIGQDREQGISSVGKTSETCIRAISSIEAKSIDAQPADMATGVFDAGRSKDSLICSTSVIRATGSASISTSCGVGRCSPAIDDGGLNDGSHLSTKESCGQLPSFQFFAESNDGINICIDLSSSPSKWIKSLKDQVQLFLNESHEVVHTACVEPVSTTHRETGSIQQEHERKKNYQPLQMESVALENSIKTTHVRQIENGLNSKCLD